MESGGNLLLGDAVLLDSIDKLRAGYTDGNNSGALRRRKVCFATWSSFQMRTVADTNTCCRPDVALSPT